MSFRADLHCHSTCSDGTVDPCRLVDAAIQLGLSGLSITDHDTVAAYETALPYAQSKDFKLLPGVEFSTEYKGESLHVLAYAFQLDHPELKKFCQRHIDRRLHRIHQMIAQLNRGGIDITFEEVMSLLEGKNVSVLGRPHIAQVLIKRGLASNVNSAFKQYLSKGSVGFVPGDAFSFEETLALIKTIQGKAIFAHPHIYPNKGWVMALLEEDFDGMECFYGRVSIDYEAVWVAYADERKWLKTGGSDFHGSVKPRIPLGCSWVGEDVFTTLYTHFLKVNAREL